MALVYLDNPDREVVLIAPKDEDPEEAESVKRTKYLVLFHPAYQHGVPAIAFPDNPGILTNLTRIHDLELTDSNQVINSIDNYQDPIGAVSATYAGRWIAGFAPIGHTGFVVIVQQHYGKTIELSPRIFWNLMAWATLAISLAIGVIAALFWRWNRPSSFS